MHCGIIIQCRGLRRKSCSSVLHPLTREWHRPFLRIHFLVTWTPLYWLSANIAQFSFCETVTRVHISFKTIFSSQWAWLERTSGFRHNRLIYGQTRRVRHSSLSRGLSFLINIQRERETVPIICIATVHYKPNLPFLSHHVQNSALRELFSFFLFQLSFSVLYICSNQSNQGSIMNWNKNTNIGTSSDGMHIFTGYRSEDIAQRTLQDVLYFVQTLYNPWLHQENTERARCEGDHFTKM